MKHWHDPSWKFKICENCRKVLGKEVEMVRNVVNGVEIWVCPKCGSTKKL